MLTADIYTVKRHVQTITHPRSLVRLIELVSDEVSHETHQVIYREDGADVSAARLELAFDEVRDRARNR